MIAAIRRVGIRAAIRGLRVCDACYGVGWTLIVLAAVLAVAQRAA